MAFADPCKEQSAVDGLVNTRFGIYHADCTYNFCLVKVVDHIGAFLLALYQTDAEALVALNGICQLTSFVEDATDGVSLLGPDYTQ